MIDDKAAPQPPRLPPNIPKFTVACRFKTPFKAPNGQMIDTIAMDIGAPNIFLALIVAQHNCLQIPSELTELQIKQKTGIILTPN